MGRICRQCLGAAALLAVGFHVGCMYDVGPQSVPSMPTVVQRPRQPAVNTADVLQRARELVGREDFRGAIETIRTLPERQWDDAFMLVAKETAADDPLRAARFSVAMPVGRAQEDALAAAARFLAAADRNTAVSWGLELQPARLRIIAVSAIAAELVARNPVAGVQWIQSMPARAGRFELLRLAVAHWTRRDPDAALAWAATLSPDVSNDVTATIAFELAQTDPQRALKVGDTLVDNRDRRLLFMVVAQTWMGRDPKAAEAWANSLAAGSARDAALAGIAAATGPIHTRRSVGVQGRYRSRVHVGGGVADSSTRLTGLERADALKREFERKLLESPAAAADWLSSLPSPDVSDDMLRRLAQTWLRQDPFAASTWFELHVPSPSRRDQILREVLP